MVDRALDVHSLTYVTEGRGWFRQENGLSVRVEAGDAFLLFPGIRHSYGPDMGSWWHEVYMVFEGPVFESWQALGLMDPARPVYRLAPVEAWERRMLSVWRNSASSLERVAMLQYLLAEMTRVKETVGLADHQLEWLGKARKQLAANAAHPNAVREAAADMGMSYQSFRKRFSLLNGYGPDRFRAEQVMETAARRLLTEDVPVKQLAAELNFCDEFHFSKRFKRHLGTSPAAYRRRLQTR